MSLAEKCPPFSYNETELPLGNNDNIEDDNNKNAPAIVRYV